MPRPGLWRVVVASAAAALAGVLTFTIAGTPSAPASASIPVPVAATVTPTVSPTSANSPAAPGPQATAPSPTTRPTGRLQARDAAPAASAPMTPPAPSRVRIPALDADLRVLPMGLDDGGAMALPESPWQAGWYRFGPRPGAPGATVIAAHVDAPDVGVGPLGGLTTLKKGASIEVLVGTSVVRYRVTEVVRVDKNDFDPEAVFSRTGPQRLHVITCGGRYDRAAGGYEDNVIAIAVPAGTR